jgi:hypothetical protein
VQLDTLVLWHYRLAWIDLGAGPFTWGPVIGGESIKSEHSLPRVEEIARLAALFNEDDTTPPSVDPLIAERRMLTEVSWQRFYQCFAFLGELLQKW